MMVQEERFRSDSKLLRELAEDAYDTCVSAIDALHALLREHDDSHDDSDSSVTSECDCGHEHEAVVAGVAETSDHDCGAAHEKLVEVPVPVPVVEVEVAALSAPAEKDYVEAIEWFKKCGYPMGQIARMIEVWRANDISQAAGREKELEVGSWATLPNKKRIMVFKGHAFEPPSDRYYGVPGPLKHLGLYDRGGARIVPSDEIPVIPQTRETYPWWTPAADRVSR